MLESTTSASAPASVHDRVSYAAVGASAASDLVSFPPEGFAPYERRILVGRGPARWAYAVDELMTWRVKTRAGFGLHRYGTFEDAELVYDRSGEPYVLPGETAVLTVGPGPFAVREPVRVIYIADEEDRRGYGYGTLPGHPLTGEEALLVERDEDGAVWFVVRSFSRPAGGWRLLAPLLWIARRIVVRRYARVLSGAI